MDLPATLDIDTERKLALKTLIDSAANGLPYEDKFRFTCGCMYALQEVADGKEFTPRHLMQKYWPPFVKGRDLVVSFFHPEAELHA